MTDNEIIKALERCIKLDCEKCDLKTRFKTATNCRNDLLECCLDLINRLQDENNHLKETNEELKVTTGLMQRRKYYKKFVEEVFQKERNNNLIYPDFDDIYRRYFEQKAELDKKDTEIDILIRKKECLRDEISGLKAEIERLKEENRILKRDVHFNESGIFNLLYGALVYTKTFEDFNKFRKDFKSETVKEFAERLKNMRTADKDVQYLFELKIDNLLKEMVGDSK